MRKYAILTAVIALAIAPQAASAQSAGNILRALSSASYSMNRRCGSGSYATSCQLSRVSNITQQFENLRRQRESERRQEMSRIRSDLTKLQSIDRSLTAACKAGDRDSCGRTTGMIDSKIMSAVFSACSSGDERSCDRMRQMHDGAYSGQTARYDAGIDRRSGYRSAR